MQKCEEYQQEILQDPDHLDLSIVAHCKNCPDCNSTYQESLRFQKELSKAMEIDAPDALLKTCNTIPVHQKYKHIGISVILFIIAITVYAIKPYQPNLDSSILEHIENESFALTANNDIDPMDVELLFNKIGMHFSGESPKIIFAEHCPLLNKFAAHLVMQGRQGAITILFTEEKIGRTQKIKNSRFQGEIVPTKKGSIAIVGEHGEELMPYIKWAKMAGS